MSPVRVGILHSLSGTMAISEAPLIDASLMALAEINKTGGVLGQSIEPVIEDGASDPALFEAKARKLIQQAQVNTIFSCCTSATVKSILPVFEELKAQLWYPGQYEGLNCSKNIFCTGSCPNQQVEPAVTWLLQNKGKRFYLIGSDSVFPHTVNKLIKAQLKPYFGSVVGEEYVSLGTGEFTEIIAQIKHSCPDVVFNTLSGDSNLAFYRQYKESGITASEIPIMAVSVAEAELQEIGDAAVGHYASWSYFQSLDTPHNRRFVKNFQRWYGADRVTSDPIEAAYTQVYLWKQAVEQAQSFEVERVRVAAYGQSFDAPGGFVRIEPNHHVGKPCRIGQVLPTGQFEIVFSSDNPIKPLPWLGIEELNFNASDVVIDRLAEVAQKVGQLEQKSQELDAVMTQLQDEIAKRQRVEAVLCDSEAQLQALFAAMTDIVLVIDAQGRYLKIAPTNAALLYKPADELIGKTLHEVFEPAQADTLLGYIRQVLDTQQTLNVEYSRSTIGEQEVWLAATISPLSEDSVLWVARDITERKQTEIRLKLLERAIAASSNGIVITDATQPNNPIIYVNPGFECITGYSAEEVIGQNSRFLQGAETMQPAIEKVRTALREQRDCHVTVRNYRKDGTLFWNQLTISPVRDAEGRLTHYVGVQTDITERKRMEEEMRQQRNFLQTMIDHLPVAVFVKDGKEDSFGEFRLWNKTSEMMFGLTSQQAIGKIDYDFFPKEQADFFYQKDRQAFERGTPEDIPEETINSYSLGPRILHTIKVPIYDENHEPQYLLGISEDITERKRAEEALRQQKELLQTIFDHIPVMVTFFDARGRMQLLNREVERVLGWPLAELRQGDLLAECYPDPESRQRVLDFMIAATGKWQDFKTRTKDGRQLDTSWANIRLSDGTSIGIGQDITERKQAEEILRNIALGVSAATGEEFFHLLVQYLAKALGVEYTFVGELLEPGHQRVRTIAICADGQTLENFDYDLEHTPCENVVQRGLCVYPHSLQEQFPLDLWLQEMGIESYLGTPLLDSTGRAVGLISVLGRSPIKDTTLMEKIMQIFAVRAAAELERRQAEEALRKAEERYRSIFENTDKGLFQTTPDGRYLSANPALARIYGYESPEELLRNLTNINQQLYVDPNRRTEFLTLMQAQGRVSNFDSQVYRKDRSLIWISENAHALRDAKGELLYYEGSVIDITMRRVWEEALRYQKECSDQLLLNILPEPIAQRLKLGETTIADSFAEVTVLFADLVKFTELAAQIPPPELVDSLNKIFSVFDQLSEKHGLEKIKTIGDAYMVVGGLPSPRPDQAEAIAEMALDMQQQITHIKRDNGEPFHLRIGIHTGPVVAGVIGRKKFSYDLWGDTVNVASRMESQGEAGGIQVTAATYERLKDKYVFARRGTTLVKGKGEMITYWLTGRKVCQLSRRN
jgi:urea transport system substrate-binding protein